MRNKIIILLISFLQILNSSKAQNVSDTLSFERLPFYGNSITMHGKHIGLSKVRKMAANIPGELQHFKNINHIRIAEYPLAVTGGFFTGFGLGSLLYVNGDITTPLFFLSSGVLILFSGFQLDYLEKQEMKAIAETYNRSIRK